MSGETIVIGAGIVGVCTAYELARRGAPVTLVDRAGVATGTTGLGEGNVLCGDSDPGPELELTLAGLRVYAELERLLGDVARIRHKGSLLVHPDPATWAAEPERVAALAAAGAGARLVEPDELRGLEPELTADVHGASRFAEDFQCDPRTLTRELAVHAEALGCRILTDTAVEAIDVIDGAACGVLAGGSVLEADTVVLAAGPWSGPLAQSAGHELPIEPRKGQLARLLLPRADERFVRHKIIEGGYLHSLASADSARQVTSVIETTVDGAVIVGSSRERVGFDTTVDMRLAVAMRARAARLVPALAQCEIEDVWIGFRPWLPDRLPAIGPSRRVPGLVIATGHEGAGIALGPITGRLVAQVICSETPGVDLAPFDPDRFFTSDED